MKCIDFDKHFLRFTEAWMEENKHKYKSIDAMEAQMPEVYLKFINTPAKWLEGFTPGSYFTEYDDPKVLVDWLYKYCVTKVPVPDLLQDRIIEVGLPCEKRLIAILKEESDTRDEGSQNAKMTAISLLREMESTAPMHLYIAWQQNRKREDELSDNAIESLRVMGRQAVKPMLEALNKANPIGQEALLDVLCNYPGEEKVYALTLKFFEEGNARQAIFAGYLAKLNDMRALPSLKKAALQENLSYLDFIEIRNAIESLGGECPEREFSQDEGYEALSMLE